MKTGSDAGILLDTCTILFIALGTAIRDEADRTIGGAARASALHVSPVSAWEIGMGAARGRISLPTEPLLFFNDFIATVGANLAPLSPEILIHSSTMPGTPHKDPMDRMLIATARLGGLVLATSEDLILKYGMAGHVRALAC